MNKNKKIQLLKVLAFPATAAFTFGFFAADIQAEGVDQEPAMQEEENNNTASSLDADPVLNTNEAEPKELIAPSDCDPESGIQGVYLGEWSMVGENGVMLMNDNLGFTGDNVTVEVEGDYLYVGDFSNADSERQAIRVRLPEGETWSYQDGVTNSHGATVVTDYSDSGYGSAIVDGADFYIETKLLTNNPDNYELETPYQIKARDILVPGKATITWKNGAVTQDGTLCNVKLVVTNIRIRVLDNGNVVQSGIENTLLGGSNKSLIAHVYTYDENGPLSGKQALGADYQVDVSITPSDGSSLAEHGATQMIYYYIDADGQDKLNHGMGAEGPYVNDADHNGTKAESLRIISGAKGPMIIYDREVEFDNPQQYRPETDYDSFTVYEWNYLRQDPQYFFNEQRLKDSGGTWFAGAHRTQPNKTGQGMVNDAGEDPETYTGFVMLVDPAGFSFRVAINQLNTYLLAQASFNPKIRVVNEGPYPNTITTTDDSADNESADQSSQPRKNPTSVDGSKGPDAQTDNQDYTYRSPWKSKKTIKAKSEDGFAISKITISKGVLDEDVDLEVINVADIPVGGSKELSNHPGMVIRRISETEVEVDVLEEYTDENGRSQKGFMTNHTLKFSSVKRPEATPDKTVDYEDEPQNGEPTFTADPKSIPEGATENKIEKITLVDDKGNEVDSIEVPGEGLYLLNENGTITFIPETGFVGKTKGVKVRGYDSNGFSTDTTYTPEVLPKPRYTIVYDPNGGQGTMSDDVFKFDEETMPFKQNTFTRKERTFAGFKAYVTDPSTGKETLVTDENGNPIIFNSPKDMKSYFEGLEGGAQIRMEAQWKYTVTYTDPATGRIIVPTVTLYNDDGEPLPPANPTREGFVFMGWKRSVDEFGNIVYEAQWAPVQKEKAAPVVTSGVQTDAQSGLGIFSTLMATSTGLFAGLARKKKDEE